MVLSPVAQQKIRVFFHEPKGLGHISITHFA